MTLSLCVGGQQGAAPLTPDPRPRPGSSTRGVVPALLALAEPRLVIKALERPPLPNGTCG